MQVKGVQPVAQSSAAVRSVSSAVDIHAFELIRKNIILRGTHGLVHAKEEVWTHFSEVAQFSACSGENVADENVTSDARTLLTMTHARHVLVVGRALRERYRTQKAVD